MSRDLLIEAALIYAFSVVGICLRMIFVVLIFEGSYDYGKLEFPNDYRLNILMPYIYPQILGCFLYGVVKPLKWPVLLKLAWSVGLCGSITTFSSFALDLFIFYGLDNGIGIVFRLLHAVSILMSTFGLGYASFVFGKSISREYFVKQVTEDEQEDDILLDPQDTAESGSSTNIYYVSAISISLVSLIAIIATAALYTQFKQDVPFLFVWLFSMFLGPVGSLLRLGLSIMNSIRAEFPCGTFTANMLGTVALGVATSISVGLNRNGKSSPDLLIWTKVISYGFAGCLSTLSTVINEMFDSELNFKQSFSYFLISVISSQVLILLTVGITEYVT
ncbi:hypothetical protein MP638_002860 [Amoeboaphelidium occidentale]|nr:hypothetical protein MP638_002860 [Amoeboaphelidium occidentale]